MSRLIDRFGRHHTYLRISVTDRCNLRCVYCMPAEGIPLKKKQEILTFEEIHRLTRIFVSLGIEKVRITGGEPLVRKGVEQLIADLGTISGIKTLAMTTNAVLLHDKVSLLKRAGLKVINISLDSLRKDRFRELTLRDDFDNVMQSIQAALTEDFQTIKLNTVVMKDKNHDEIMDFVHFAKDKRLNVRFIEFMPFKDNQWLSENVVSFADMRAMIEREFELIPLSNQPGDVGKDFAIKGFSGTVSFITSMTDSFCSSCNRLRITADGSMKTCLFYAPEVNLRDVLRSGASDAEITQVILTAVTEKPEAHPPMDELALADNRAMVEIGG